MQVRPALAEEIPTLRARLAATGMEQIDLDKARVWVAIENGAIVGFLSARMTWQLEPLYIFPELQAKNTRRRAVFGLYRAAEAWLADRGKNLSGIHWFFAITRSKAVKGWAQQMGMHRQYRGAATFLKYL